MIELYKKRGETPLEALTRLRIEKPEFASETLSYAGRLDPMAEGIIPILVGEHENKNRNEYLKKDKEYRVEFLLGCSTDTGDILGVVDRVTFDKTPKTDIIQLIKNFIHIKEQTYPWYSSKTVDGIPLFKYARENNFSIQRPTREVQIYEVSDIDIKDVSTSVVLEYVVAGINLVHGDFRQNESIKSWQEVLQDSTKTFTIASCTLKVSSGTYIRSLNDYIFTTLKVPSVVYSLVRTRIL